MTANGATKGFDKSPEAGAAGRCDGRCRAPSRLVRKNSGTFRPKGHPKGFRRDAMSVASTSALRSIAVSPNVHALDRVRTPQPKVQKPSRAEVEAAVRTIIRWTGEDPERDGLIETPARVTRSYEEFFSGYGQDPVEILEKTFEEIEGYDEMIVLRDIGFESHCEHHMAPIIGRAWVAYIPNGRVVGISNAGTGGGCVCQAPADPGKDDGANRQHHQRCSQAAGRRRDHQGDASLHDHPRRPQTRHRPGHQPHAGLLPRQRADPHHAPSRSALAAPHQKGSRPE